MKFALMAEPSRISNADPWNLVIRPISSRPEGAAENGTKMTKSPEPIAVFTDVGRVRAFALDIRCGRSCRNGRGTRCCRRRKGQTGAGHEWGYDGH